MFLQAPQALKTRSNCGLLLESVFWNNQSGGMCLRSFEALRLHGCHDFFQRFILTHIEVQDDILVKIPLVIYCFSLGHSDGLYR
jgi:hypothetical protein